MLKQKKGITLIALVVTIIVLLILAGVTIMSITGENGIITKGQDSSVNTENGKVAEMLSLKSTDTDIDVTIDDFSERVLDYLKADGYINTDLTVNADTVTGESLKTGKGTLDTGDIYYLKEIDLGIYHLIYLDSNKVENDLGIVIAEDEESQTLIYVGVINRTFYNNYYTNYVGVRTFYSYYTWFNVSNGSVTCQKNFPSYVTKLVVPEKVDGIKCETLIHGAFYGLENLKTVVLPDGIKNISYLCFSGCKSLENINIPNSVRSIGASAFSSCGSLKEITIPEGVISIESSAFHGCTSINNITIPKSVTTIGKKAFNGWTADQTINVYFSEGEMGTDWLEGCSATINYNYSGE